MITAIILTFNEAKHISRCIKSLNGVCERVVVVDSYSSDGTDKLATECGAEVLRHEWPNNHAKQLNWALGAIDIGSPWTMRLDADEYLTHELKVELISRLPHANENVSGFVVPRLVLYRGRPIRWGGFYPQELLRIWRTGLGHSESRLMDEHIVVEGGRLEKLRHNLIDHNLNDTVWWSQKHLNYARREAAQEILSELQGGPSERDVGAVASPQAIRKRWLKNNVYRHLPLGGRAAAYLGYRFLARAAFLDHPSVWRFHLLQGGWYRLMVDLCVHEFREKHSGLPEDEQVQALRTEWNIDL